MAAVDLIASTADPVAVATSVIVAAGVAAISQLIRTRQDRRKLSADTDHIEAETALLVQQAAREATKDLKAYYESRLRIVTEKLADARAEIEQLRETLGERDRHIEQAQLEYSMLLAEYTDLRARAKHAGLDTT